MATFPEPAHQIREYLQAHGVAVVGVDTLRRFLSKDTLAARPSCLAVGGKRRHVMRIRAMPAASSGFFQLFKMSLKQADAIILPHLKSR